ncbi:hypothetical protein Metbo_2308 [Methanobacterium lacus]|uniref:Uncharacterized protein n=1 Tax=Methanobacterium lacus (strain AL-21) TaxID=877455 RepID=F0T615_METLA|nr:hypothetical protein [Methanobacterium lacus]ADZ10522.1 hypothetical protein Metbo_2308 [Methanobacterium lacus]
MVRSLDPHIKNFDVVKYRTNLYKHLQKIDEIEYYNSKIRKTTSKPKRTTGNNFKSVEDQRILFRQILGVPVHEYPEKEYVMYNCPFHDHEDKNLLLALIKMDITVTDVVEKVIIGNFF